MKNLLIGITGNKGAGKDIAANMLKYIIQASSYYKKDGIDYNVYKNIIINTDYTPKIHHFADPLKDVISILFNINRSDLDDRDKKDVLFYNIKNRIYRNASELTNDDILINEFKQNDISRPIMVKHYKYINQDNVYIRLRALLQFVGTNIFQNVFGKNVWINSIIGNLTGCDIIADVRFKTEEMAIVEHGGKIISIINSTYNNNNDNHQSEKEISYIQSDWEIIWDGNDKEYLFNQLKEFYYESVRQYIK